MTRLTTRTGVGYWPKRFLMDDARQIADLKALAIAEARQSEDESSQRFLDVPAEPFVPHFAPPSAADSGGTKAPYNGVPVIARL